MAIAAVGLLESTPGSVTAVDYAASYANATDLLAYLDRVAHAANDGNPDALYWSYRAARRCTRDYALYFGRPDRNRSLDEALAFNSQVRLDDKTTREIYSKCAGFKAAASNPYRDYQAILARAADAGSSVAKATLAFDLLGKRMEAQNSPASAAALTKVEEQIRSLARDAMQSRDPAALFLLGDVTAGLRSKPVKLDANGQIEANIDPETEEISDVWMIAACQRGYDCSVDNEEFRYVCGLDDACQPSDTIVDMLRRQHPEKFAELELRATELNAKLDAGRFDDIDL